MRYAEDDEDIVSLLRKGADDNHPYVQTWLARSMRRAADEIEQLRSSITNIRLVFDETADIYQRCVDVDEALVGAERLIPDGR